MSSEDRWMINDALGLLLQLSRSCCLAPVRFVKIRTDTFIYISRPLHLFSVIIGSILHLCAIYFLNVIDSEHGYIEMFLAVFIILIVIVIVSYAVLHSETRIRNYMTGLTKLRRVIRDLHCTEDVNIKKWHILIILIILCGGINVALILYDVIYIGSISPLTYIMMLEFTMLVIVQQQFLYFALHVIFVLKIIKEQLQEEFTKIINDKDEKQLGSFTTSRINIPLKSINKAIDMIGMTDKLFPDVRTTERQNIEHKIRQIKDCYVLACAVLHELSSTDDCLLFLLLIYYSISIVFSSYGIIKLVLQGSLLSAKLIVHCLKFLVIAARIIMIVEPCHVAHERILKIRFLVCKIMCHVTSTSDPIFRVIDGFFHQLVLNDISYTALGMYKIGRPLITSIIAVATTILTTIFEF